MSQILLRRALANGILRRVGTRSAFAARLVASTATITSPAPAPAWHVKAARIAQSDPDFVSMRQVVETVFTKTNPKLEVINLSIGDPTVYGNLVVSDVVRDAVINAVQSGKWNGYTTSFGDHAARKAVADYHSRGGRTISPEDVVLTQGCVNSLMLCLNVLASPGENIIIPRPGFTMIQSQAYAHSIEVRFYNLRPEKNWEVDLVHLDRQIDGRTAAILVNNPSNPCGSVFTRDHMFEILDLAERRKIPLISDDVYEDFDFCGVPDYYFSELSERVPVLSTGSISKKFLVPGWRLGWVIMHDRGGVFNDEVRRGLRHLCQLVLGPCSLLQAALPTILNETPCEHIYKAIDLCQSNAEHVHSYLVNTPGLHPIQPRGAMFLMVGVDMECFPSFADDMSFCHSLLEEFSVFTMPGRVFNYPNYFRLILTAPQEKLDLACERITSFCQRYYQKPKLNDIFHLDHCGGLPWFLQKTAFRGRCFMTHATKAIYRWLLADYVKVSNLATDDQLYTEQDIIDSMDKIEVLNFHQIVDAEGVKFSAYTAGHVLGAAMFLIEIAGVQVLYTGDFSCVEDRHLMAAETPAIRPDVMICEATYGVTIQESREKRERRFTNLVHSIIQRGGRCLIPVFALGRAQELLLILDEYWSQHPELHDVPIYYASALARKCMSVYQTYINAMNERIRRQITVNNPFIFKHISNLRNMERFDDLGPSVVLASPGMMQSGLSRELFENWCTDSRNGVIIAGYVVEGTLAKLILSEPEEVITMNGARVPLKCSVDYISFSAHTDYKQTSGFIRSLRPPHLVLVHGEKHEMGKLKAALVREYEDSDHKMEVFSPANTQAVELQFRGEKVAKVVGRLAAVKPKVGELLSGVLVKRNFNFHLVDPTDLINYTEMSTGQILQRQSLAYSGKTLNLLWYNLSQMACHVEKLSIEGNEALRVFGVVTVVHQKPSILIVEWPSSPSNDMYADAVQVVIMQTERQQRVRAETDPQQRPASPVIDTLKGVPPAVPFDQSLMELLNDMFGPECLRSDKLPKKLGVVIDETETVECSDETLEELLQTVVRELKRSTTPATLPTLKSPADFEQIASAAETVSEPMDVAM